MCPWEYTVLFFKEMIMELMERRAERVAAPSSSFGNDDTGPDPLHDAAANFLRAADAAVTNALSGNSQEFLSRMRQEGGE